MYLTSHHIVRLAPILLILIHSGQARKGKFHIAKCKFKIKANLNIEMIENDQTSDSFGISCGYFKPTMDRHLKRLFQTRLNFCMKDLHFSTLNSTFVIYIQLSEAQNNTDICTFPNCKIPWLIEFVLVG